MTETEKYLKLSLAANGKVSGVVTNQPVQFADRQKQYMARQTRDYVSRRAYLSSDFVSATIDGLISDDFYATTELNIRLADVKSNTNSNVGDNDDYKQVLIPDLAIDYIPLGAKIKTMGNTWLVVNPSNISSTYTSAVCRRCNSSFNAYDDYGNVVSEPIIVDAYEMNSNDNTTKQNLELMQGYFKITCQKNNVTENLKINKRLILGSQAYHITGVQDFIQEFSDDKNSVHLMTFTARLEEYVEKDDISSGVVAENDNSTYVSFAHRFSSLAVGQSSQITPLIIKNGEIQDIPVTWQFDSNRPELATVDDEGWIECVSHNISSPHVFIHCSTKENPSLFDTLVFTTDSAESAKDYYISFVEPKPKKISQFTSVTINANLFYYENGTAVYTPLVWEFSGATPNNYVASVSEDGKSAEILCFHPDDKPLKVTVSCDYGGSSYKTSTNIYLSGY